MSVAHNDKWLPRLTETFRKLGLKVDAKRRQFRPHPFPEGRRAAMPTLRTRSCRRAASYTARVAAYGLPNALRMTIGSDEANERTIAALTEFMSKR